VPRQALGGATKSITSVLTPGYAPLEQYSSDGNQGPWTDIYAMAGVLYRAFANDNPPDAVSRMKADTVPGKLSALRGRVSEPLLRSVEWALTLDEHQRPQSVPEWKRALEGATPAPVTSRPAAPFAPTLRPGAIPSVPSQPFPKPQPAYETRRPTRLPPEEPRSGWRWVGIVVAVLVAVAVVGAWNKQRAAEEREREETAKIEAERAADMRKDLERSAVERRRAEDEERRLVAPPSGPITMDLPPPGPAPATEPAPKPAPSFRERPGRDRDERPGPLEDKKEKLLQMVEQEFRGADRNGDGYLAPDEVRGRFPAIEHDFRGVDADRDGRISLQEFFQFRRMQAEQRFKKK